LLKFVSNRPIISFIFLVSRTISVTVSFCFHSVHFVSPSSFFFTLFLIFPTLINPSHLCLFSLTPFLLPPGPAGSRMCR
jgi:hypothetical protein